MRLRTASATETTALGLKLGRLLKALDLVCLQGDLGSGKTTMTKGIAKGVGYRGRVTSPTFGLAREYRGGRLKLYHVDLYRLGSGELGDVGIEDFVRDPKAACVVEWPRAGAAYWPKDRLELSFAHVGEGVRTIAFKALGPRSRQLLARLRAR